MQATLKHRQMNSLDKLNPTSAQALPIYNPNRNRNLILQVSPLGHGPTKWHIKGINHLRALVNNEGKLIPLKFKFSHIKERRVSVLDVVPYGIPLNSSDKSTITNFNRGTYLD